MLGTDATQALEAGLDALILDLAAGDARAVADVFVERATRLRLGFEASDAELRRRAPRRRDLEGAALRLLVGGAARFVHVSGADEGALRRLAALAAGRAGAAAPPGPGSPTAGDGASGDDLAPPAELLHALAEAAGARLRGNAALAAVDVDVSVERRCVHVASSEWGHAATQRHWTSVTVEARSRSGARSGRARRGHGACAPVRGEAAVRLAAELVGAAVAAAQARLDAVPARRGTPAVVLGPGAGGVFVHEVVGHALEADLVARGATPLAGRFGERVGPAALTVVDDPTLTGRAGSYDSDDEGVTPRRVVLVDAGVLAGTVTDGASVGFRRGASTGHGRRSSYREPPLPRLSNTHVLAGPDAADDLVRGVADGIHVDRLERAAADPLSGIVELRVVEGWRIEGGRRTSPLADVVLVARAPDALGAVDGVAGDTAWDDGCGTCGRDGQWVPVAVGQPTLRIASGAVGVA